VRKRDWVTVEEFRAWRAALAAFDVLVDEGLLVVNMKNHVRAGRVESVVEWWIGYLLGQGCALVDVERLTSQGIRQGANHAARVESEFVISVRRPARGRR